MIFLFLLKILIEFFNLQRILLTICSTSMGQQRAVSQSFSMYQNQNTLLFPDDITWSQLLQDGKDRELLLF